MKLKKLLMAILVAISMMALVACGNDKSSSREDKEQVESDKSSDDKEIDEDKESDEDKDSDEDKESEEDKDEEPDKDEDKEDVKDEPDEKDEDKKEEPLDTEVSIEETILVDEKDIKITATEIEFGRYDLEVSLTIENNSDKDLSFVSGSIGYCNNSINGYMIEDAYFHEDVTAGKKANTTIGFSLDEMAALGITEVADIKIGFDVSDDDYKDYYQGVGEIKTSKADSYNYDSNTYDEIMSNGAFEDITETDIKFYERETIYDEENVQIVSKAWVVDGEEEYLLLELVNNSDEDVIFAISDVVFNNLCVYEYSYESITLSKGARGVMSIDISSVIEDDYKELFGINEIGEVRFEVKLTNVTYDVLKEGDVVSIIVDDSVGEFDASGTEVYNDNDIRIVYKAIIEDPWDYSESYHVVMFVENGKSKEISIDDWDDTLSINGYMADNFFLSVEVSGNSVTIVDIEIDEDWLDDNDIGSVEDINELTVTLRIRDDGWDTIDEAEIDIAF